MTKPATRASNFDFLLYAQIGLVRSSPQGKEVTFWAVTKQLWLLRSPHMPGCGAPDDIFWWVIHPQFEGPFSLHLLSSALSLRAPSPQPGAGLQGASGLPLELLSRGRLSSGHGQHHNSGFRAGQNTLYMIIHLL